MDLKKFELRTSCTEKPADLEEFIPVFHRWIQRQALPGLLIDVADYRHVAGGPGIVLIGHEGDYGICSKSPNELILYYREKGRSDAGGDSLLLRGFVRLVQAVRLIGYPFATDRFILVLNDRAGFPPTADKFKELSWHLSQTLGRILNREPEIRLLTAEPRERLAVDICFPRRLAPRLLLKRFTEAMRSFEVADHSPVAPEG